MTARRFAVIALCTAIALTPITLFVFAMCGKAEPPGVALAGIILLVILVRWLDSYR